MNHQELERVFREWCLRHGILEGPPNQPTTPAEAERDLRILEWVLDGRTPSPSVAARLAELRALASQPDAVAWESRRPSQTPG